MATTKAYIFETTEGSLGPGTAAEQEIGRLMKLHGAVGEPLTDLPKDAPTDASGLTPAGFVVNVPEENAYKFNQAFGVSPIKGTATVIWQTGIPSAPTQTATDPTMQKAVPGITVAPTNGSGIKTQPGTSLTTAEQPTDQEPQPAAPPGSRINIIRIGGIVISAGLVIWFFVRRKKSKQGRLSFGT